MSLNDVLFTKHVVVFLNKFYKVILTIREDLSMKKILFLLSLVASLFSTNLFAADYKARNCEIFIDRALVVSGSHAAKTLVLFIKTLNTRLDSAILEVGFYNQETKIGPRTQTPTTSPWTSIVGRNFPNANDYFIVSIPVSNDYLNAQYEGAVYVKTVNGTTYWAQANDEKNFVFTKQTADYLLSKMGYMPAYDFDVLRALNTQRSDLNYFNGSRCY